MAHCGCRSEVGVPSDQGEGPGCPQDCIQVPLWPLRVFGDALQADQRTGHLSVMHEPHFPWSVEEVCASVL